MAVAPRVDGKGGKSEGGNVCRDAVLLICGLVLAAALYTWVQGREAAGASGQDFSQPMDTPEAALAGRGLGSASSASSALLGGLSSGGSGSGSGSGSRPAPRAQPVFKTFIRDICNGTERYPEEEPDYDVMGQPGSSIDEWDNPMTAEPGSSAGCHWTPMWHPAVPMKPVNVCTHDPKIDTVISHFLHTYHFWGSPDDYLILLATGPCTPERPYMMDIGANLGVYSILGASRGCHLVAFEPLSQNILRLKASLDENGWGERSLLYKHAVGKTHATVRIGFRPSNPGASALGHGGDEEEVIDQITIDNLLLGKNPPKFKAPKGHKELPPFLGKYINFVKIDTEGYDTAVFDGALSTLMEGRVPHILIEFTPGDAQGTAGCDSWNFMRLIYANKYRMYEFR
jgi:FkbM family methyltransferase